MKDENRSGEPIPINFEASQDNEDDSLDLSHSANSTVNLDSTEVAESNCKVHDEFTDEESRLENDGEVESNELNGNDSGHCISKEEDGREGSPHEEESEISNKENSCLVKPNPVPLHVNRKNRPIEDCCLSSSPCKKRARPSC
jgi:hypothetical protein